MISLKIKEAYALRDSINVHYYLTKQHTFTDTEISALQEFTAPLEVAMSCWDSSASEDLDICDMLDKIDAKDCFQLADGTMPEADIPNGLPDLCWSVLPVQGKLICIKRGKSGYYPSDWETGDAERSRETADFANERREITKAQELAMDHGSMVGWNTLGAGPKTRRSDEMLNMEKLQQIREQYPPGTRVRLNCMPNDPHPVPPDTEGFIRDCDDEGHLLTRWSNGRDLSLIPGVDDFTVISRPEKE